MFEQVLRLRDLILIGSRKLLFWITYVNLDSVNKLADIAAIVHHCHLHEHSHHVLLPELSAQGTRCAEVSSCKPCAEKLLKVIRHKQQHNSSAHILFT